MSSGHHSVHVPSHGTPEYEAHSAIVNKLLENPDFARAVAAYREEDDTHDIPFLGGSNNAGTCIYFDRQFVAAIKAGRVKYEGKPYDPRPFLKVHEAVEGAAIRLLHANYDTDNAQKLPGGHLIATWAERRAVEHAGLDWVKYQDSLKPWITADEHERATDPPGDLLTVPYKGTPQDAEVEPKVDGASDMSKLTADSRNRMASSTFGLPGKRAYPMPDKGHAANAKARATQQFNKGNLSGSQRSQINAKANRVLGKSPGGYVPNPAQNAAVHASERDRQGGGVQGSAPMPRNMHALSMASATHLHNAGYIGKGMKGAIHAHAKMRMGKMKMAQPVKPATPSAFGSLAPMTPPTNEDY